MTPAPVFCSTVADLGSESCGIEVKNISFRRRLLQAQPALGENGVIRWFGILNQRGMFSRCFGIN